MSQTNNDDRHIPEPAQAWENLVTLRNRIILDKAAAAGFVPRNEDEALTLIETANRLEEAHLQKQAEQSSHNRFAALFGTDEQDNSPLTKTADLHIKKLASTLLRDEEVYDSVLSLVHNAIQQGG